MNKQKPKPVPVQNKVCLRCGQPLRIGLDLLHPLCKRQITKRVEKVMR